MTTMLRAWMAAGLLRLAEWVAPAPPPEPRFADGYRYHLDAEVRAEETAS